MQTKRSKNLQVAVFILRGFRAFIYIQNKLGECMSIKMFSGHIIKLFWTTNGLLVRDRGGILSGAPCIFVYNATGYSSKVHSTTFSITCDEEVRFVGIPETLHLYLAFQRIRHKDGTKTRIRWLMMSFVVYIGIIGLYTVSQKKTPQLWQAVVSTSVD